MYEIRYSKEFNRSYVKLKKKAAKGSREAEYLIGLIRKAKAMLAEDREAGKKIPRKKWPKEYIQKYNINNLWRYKLDSYWRLVYTIMAGEIDFFLIYLEYIDHKKYDRKFGYKTS